MPSPFPGMDPYIEDPAIWPDFHDRFAALISSGLNATLREPYYAQLGVREEIGILEDEQWHRIIPDVAVQRTPDRGGAEGSIAVVDRPRVEVSEFEEVILDRPKVNFVEIRDARSGHEVVTLIEILSPSNKRPGPDADSYRKKRENVLASDTSLVEIDLLRTGDRSFFGLEVLERLVRRRRPGDYFVLVSRSWRRGCHHVFPVPITESLPVIPVPLREQDSEQTLDLQYVFQQTYDSGPYRRRIDYNAPAEPPLPEPLQAWASECINSRAGQSSRHAPP